MTSSGGRGILKHGSGGSAGGGAGGSGGGSGGGGSSSSSSEEFDRALAKVAVVQVCEALGFQGFQKSATDILTDICIRYLVNLAKSAHSYCNIAGRTQCNALDVILALEDLGTGPRTVLDPSRSVSASSALRDVMNYVECMDEIPFARPVPRFPVSKKRALAPSFAVLGETPPHPHIPAWLPAFPDPHTYKATPVWNGRKTDLRADQREQAKQRRKGERSLMSLNLALSSGGGGISPAEEAMRWPPPTGLRASSAGVHSTGVGLGQHSTLTSKQHWPSRDQDQQQVVGTLETEQLQKKVIGKRTVDSRSPFLANLLAPREEILSVIPHFKGSSVESQSKKITLPSAVQALAPAIQAVAEESQETSMISSMDFSAFGALPDAKDRAPVHLAFDWGRKTRANAAIARLSLGLNDASLNKKKGIHSNGKDEEKDDKRKRVEQILAQAMDGLDNEAQA